MTTAILAVVFACAAGQSRDLEERLCDFCGFPLVKQCSQGTPVISSQKIPALCRVSARLSDQGLAQWMVTLDEEFVASVLSRFKSLRLGTRLNLPLLPRLQRRHASTRFHTESTPLKPTDFNE